MICIGIVFLHKSNRDFPVLFQTEVSPLEFHLPPKYDVNSHYIVQKSIILIIGLCLKHVQHYTLNYPVVSSSSRYHYAKFTLSILISIWVHQLGAAGSIQLRTRFKTLISAPNGCVILQNFPTLSWFNYTYFQFFCKHLFIIMDKVEGSIFFAITLWIFHQLLQILFS